MKVQLVLLVLAPTVFALALACNSSPPRSSSAPLASSLSIPVAERPAGNCGRMLYTTYCAVCHGDTGRGDGELADKLDPMPRDFSLGGVRLISSPNQAATDGDLFSTITEGMPGTAMPSWGHLSEGDRWALVGHIRSLLYDGATDRILEAALEEDEPMERDEAAGIAASRIMPDSILTVPTDLDRTATGDAEALYLEHCGDCHGKTGLGDGEEEQKDERGNRVRPRDFQSGIFKGSEDPRALFLRVRAGMPGSPMPATELGDGATAAIVRHISSMATPGAREQNLQERLTLVATRVDRVPARADAQEWEQAPVVVLPLMPMHWERPLSQAAELRLVFDQERFAARVSYSPVPGAAGTPGGGALQLADFDAPTVFSGETGRGGMDWNFLEIPAGIEDRFRPHARVAEGGTAEAGGQHHVLFSRDRVAEPFEVALGTGDDLELALLLFEVDPVGGMRHGFTVWHDLVLSGP